MRLGPFSEARPRSFGHRVVAPSWARGALGPATPPHPTHPQPAWPPPFSRPARSYAIAARFGQLIEEIEYDDWNLPVEGADQDVPSWCRAAFAMRSDYDALNTREWRLRSPKPLKALR